jgi:hypothetical protein
MGCSPDVIEVYEGATSKLSGKSGDFHFVVSFRIKMFQKRLRSAEKLTCEFVAGGTFFVLLGLLLTLTSCH